MSNTFAKFKWAFAIGLVAVLALSLAVGCSDDSDDNGNDETPVADETPQATEGSSDADIAEVEDVFTQAFESDGTNAEYFFAHVTDNIITAVLFSPSREECEANAEECIGDPGTVESISDTTIDGDSATLTAATDFGVYVVGMVRVDGVWMVDTFGAASDEVPEGTPLVDLTLGEYVFGLDQTTIPADGNFAFHINNAGGQVHEAVVVPISADGDLESALQALEESETEPETAGQKVFIAPGQEVDLAFDAPLAPGRYALVCFFPDTSSPDFTPHAELGMINEFTIE